VVTGLFIAELPWKPQVALYGSNGFALSKRFAFPIPHNSLTIIISAEPWGEQFVNFRQRVGFGLVAVEFVEPGAVGSGLAVVVLAVGVLPVLSVCLDFLAGQAVQRVISVVLVAQGTGS